tara:strand:+ start:1130 stop:1573 length:444 start_codon:yes stop_codon:yes gene_type:complete
LDIILETSAVFFSALLSATLIPATSEAVLIATALNGDTNLWLLALTATFGNTAGAIINWAIGIFLSGLSKKSWFPIKKKMIVKAEDYFKKYGIWSLLFSWLPIIGDPLTLVAGYLKVPFLTFCVLVFLGKGARYFFIVQFFSGSWHL